MFSEAYHSTLKLSATVFLISIFSLVVPETIAADLQSDTDHKVTSSGISTADTNNATPDSGQATPTGTRSTSTQSDEQSSGANSSQSGTSAPTTASATAATPLTPGQKFKYSARSS